MEYLKVSLVDAPVVASQDTIQFCPCGNKRVESNVIISMQKYGSEGQIPLLLSYLHTIRETKGKKKTTEVFIPSGTIQKPSRDNWQPLGTIRTCPRNTSPDFMIRSRLQFFVQAGSSSILDKLVLSVISAEWYLYLHHHFILSLISHSQEEVVCQTSSPLFDLDRRPRELITKRQHFKGIYLILFVVPKISEDWRAVLILKRVGNWVRMWKFQIESLWHILQVLQMETSSRLTQISRCIQTPDSSVSTTNTEHCPLACPQTPECLPRVVMLANVRQKGSHVYPYLNHILKREQDADSGLRATRRAAEILQEHGFLEGPNLTVK